MKRFQTIVTLFLIVSLLSSVSVLTTGCQTARDHRIATGAVLGTAAGAAAGAAIGGSGRRTEGALIGAAAGAALGTGVGYYLERRARRFEQVEGVEVTTNEQTQSFNLRLSSELLFDVNSSSLTSEGVAKVQEIARILNEEPTARVIVRGYTSSEGGDEYNLNLSRRRAEVVRDTMIGSGVAPARIQAVGLGSSNPIADNNTPEGRMRNRRVEIEVFPEVQQ